MKLVRPFLLLPCLAASLFACDSAKKTEPAKTDAKAEAKQADAKAEAKTDVKAEAKADAKAAEPPKPEVTTAAPPEPVAPPPALAAANPHGDLVLDEMKDWYGLQVPEVDGWKPTWEPDTVGIQWSKDGNVDVTMTLNPKPIEKVEDIDVGYMAGTTLSKQDPPTKTAKGWYTIVTTEDGKSQGFIFVRQIGKSYLSCDALMSRSEGDTRPAVPTETLVKICESPEPAA